MRRRVDHPSHRIARDDARVPTYWVLVTDTDEAHDAGGDAELLENW
ncbi:hypothetical protein ACI78R_08635 [Geodermatophilus sp. SYSU D01106]